MIFGVSPTRDAVVIAHATGSGEAFAIKSITPIPFRVRSGNDLRELLRRLVVVFGRAGKSRRSTIALLGSSSGRFKSSVEAIKAEAVTELAAAESGLPVVKVTAASLKKALGCAVGQKWQVRAAERFNRTGRHKNWSRGAAGAAAAALKVAGADFTSVARTLRVREASLKGSPHKSALRRSEKRCGGLAESGRQPPERARNER